MKVVIIGGGIAGMTMGAFLQEEGVDVVICEKMAGVNERGHAFLIHTEALSVLTSLAGGRPLPGTSVRQFHLRGSSGIAIKQVAMDSWRCMRRNELTDHLESMLTPGSIVGGRTFSHFIQEGDRVTAAVFANGDVEYGDLFVGADGGHSKVRESLFGKVAYTPVAVKEIVGICRDPAIARHYAHSFIKFQEQGRGLAFGLIPTRDQESVWFMQYDPRIADVVEDSPAAIRSLCELLLKDFPAEVRDIVTGNDFTKTYIWHTKDFDLLSRFHRDNVVLIGDAAHLTLPFTSAGTTNAIIDAKVLTDCLSDADTPSAAFSDYYRLRSGAIGEHIQLGRQLRAIFLSPEKAEAQLPFMGGACRDARVVGSSADIPAVPSFQKIKVNYFTDPICSTCWIIQPAWKKLHLEYGRYLDIRYVMGGLLPSWKDCKGKIQSPSDAALHWKEVSDYYKMPLDAGVWTEDPLSSSFPPSIAFKAAQLQDEQKALLFLRRIREMIFLEKKNIMKWRFLEMAALEVGLDTARFRQDYGCDARTAFGQDLDLADRLGVVSFPTMIFTDPGGRYMRIKGYQHYKDFEQMILELAPHAVREEIDREPESLFSYFPTMVDEEFALLSNMKRKDARKLLQELNQQGYIEKVEAQNGVLWRRRAS